MDGAPNCSRLGCDEPAVAVFAFDARECLVWLDPLGDGGRGAGVLCDAHADRMSPPRGWNLLDRRAVESRLWLGRAVTSASAPVYVTPTTRRREHTPRSRALSAPGPLLPFDAPNAPDAPVTLEPEAPTRAPAPTPARTSWSPHDRPGPEFEHVLDARTPLLARAFESSRPTDDE